ncbi:hypothetical protein NDU88_007222 [Pleurodeles waltl]|uniref:Uncharacterized protein n=1 Tax=Pleurodeles waltl TaxID=8319 RepID=A0AAV7SS59_PLEWA|nr:hypothetical protein NDU88_007222 [Pleurodeles waltl]
MRCRAEPAQRDGERGSGQRSTKWSLDHARYQVSGPRRSTHGGETHGESEQAAEERKRGRSPTRKIPGEDGIGRVWRKEERDRPAGLALGS